MTDQPNIIYILADDLGYGDVAWLNDESKIPTPHMDRIASSGMTFTDCHSNSAVCTPTRYGVLTGRYAWRGRLKSGVLWGYSAPLIEPGRLTVASMLRNCGYATACIGKWHLGLGWHLRDGGQVTEQMTGVEDPGVDFAQRLTAGPHTVGFDYSCILPASLDMAPYCYIENGRVIEPTMRQVPQSPRPKMWRAGATCLGFEHETCLLELTRRAETYIARQQALCPDRPFFLYLPLPSPHTPHVPRPPFVGASGAGAYGDYVVEHDWSVGRIMEALDRHGLTENTLVIVTSDNGPHVRGAGFDYQREYGHSSTGIFRGQKSDAWDGGHRVPFFARWPGVIAPGSTCAQPICLTDLLATCAAITGQTLPADAGEDSFNLLPWFDQNQDAPGRPATIHHSMDGRFAIRDKQWKLIECRGSGGWSLPEEEVEAHAPPGQLYDLDADPSEQRNLYEDQPDVVAGLSDTLERMRSSPRSIGQG
jgi:arylsulfatase A-like enzyme